MTQRNNFLPRFTGEVVRRTGRGGGNREDKAMCFSTHDNNDFATPSASHTVLGTSPAMRRRKIGFIGPAAQGRKVNGMPP